ncbi:hypothetical protein [Fretibacter rubidus]|uniref:hypothetical protein n=1 Tax=Fretibacter rubidus TaxID=570162 RepID=UPI00352A1F5C
MRKDGMTARELEQDWLSLRCWLLRCVGPAAVILLLTLGAFRLITDRAQMLDQNAVIVGFFILYFVIVRGGHMLMIRSMHNELLSKYEGPYKARLAALPRRGKSPLQRRSNIGFTLAKIKRDLITEFGAR